MSTAAPAIELHEVAKTYATYRHGVDRLLEVLTGRSRHHEFVALQPTTLRVAPGEVLGVVGMNGAGKSTLLKILARTLAPSSGRVVVNGLVSALLELGTGFHPEMSGRENVYLYGAVMGLSRARIDAQYEHIVAFSGLADFMEQPVKTYSSGMFVRLAFAVATSVDPEILIVDEALSVGDGAFARKSFERMMGFREAGKTIVFCSHSLYQVEAVCTRAIWMHHGRIMLDAAPAEVIARYNEFLARQELPTDIAPEAPAGAAAPAGQGRIVAIEVSGGGHGGRELQLVSGRDDLRIAVRYAVDPTLPAPTLAVVLAAPDGKPLSSAISLQDGVALPRDADGSGEASVCFPRLALLKGRYTVQVYLACENAVHSYDMALDAASVHVAQQGLEQGVVTLPRAWSVGTTGQRDAA